jgi:nucleoside 2-deoxyribosyltransferase
VTPPTTVIGYLAGPDVFLRNAVEHTTRKVAIYQRFSFRGLPLLNQDVETVAKKLKPSRLSSRKTPR